MEEIRTNSDVQGAGKAKRRNYPADFKADIVQLAQTGDNSVAGVALQHGINPVTVHRWIREARHFQTAPTGAFVPLDLNSLRSAPGPSGSAQASPPQTTIRIELAAPDAKHAAHHAACGITLHWPLAARHELSTWLKDWLR